MSKHTTCVATNHTYDLLQQSTITNVNRTAEHRDPPILQKHFAAHNSEGTHTCARTIQAMSAPAELLEPGHVHTRSPAGSLTHKHAHESNNTAEFLVGQCRREAKGWPFWHSG